MRQIALLLLATGLFSLASCDPNRVYEENIPIENRKWTYEQEVSFKVDIPDTTQRYTVYINIRHSDQYDWRNLWVKVYTTLPDGETLEQELNLPLADNAGKWHGKCSGDICRLRVPVQVGAIFPQMGTYTFRFNQWMRVEKLPGIMDMGLRVEKAD